METFSIIFLYSLGGLLTIGFIIVMYHEIKKIIIFKPGRNPFHRICRICGQHQVMYEREKHQTWWEDVYPNGDDNCQCHKYSIF